MPTQPPEAETETGRRSHPGRGHRHAHRARPGLRDGGADHPGHPHPHLEDGPGHPAGRPRALGPPRRQGLPGLRGRADHLRRALPHRRHPGPRPRPTGSAIAKGDRVAIAMRNLPEWVMAFWASIAGGCRRRPPQRLVDRARAGLRPERLGHHRGLRRRGAPEPDPPPPRRDPRPAGHGGVLRGARPGGGRRAAEGSTVRPEPVGARCR